MVYFYSYRKLLYYSTTNSQNIFGTYLSYNAPNIEVLKGECGALTNVACLFNAGVPTRITTTPGETYYIRVVTPNIPDAFTFDLCVSSVPRSANKPKLFYCN